MDLSKIAAYAQVPATNKAKMRLFLLGIALSATHIGAESFYTMLMSKIVSMDIQTIHNTAIANYPLVPTNQPGVNYYPTANNSRAVIHRRGLDNRPGIDHRPNTNDRLAVNPTPTLSHTPTSNNNPAFFRSLALDRILINNTATAHDTPVTNSNKRQRRE